MNAMKRLVPLAWSGRPRCVWRKQASSLGMLQKVKKQKRKAGTSVAYQLRVSTAWPLTHSRSPKQLMWRELAESPPV